MSLINQDGMKKFALTPALSRPTGEGESFTVPLAAADICDLPNGLSQYRKQPIAVPSPILMGEGQGEVRVRGLHSMFDVSGFMESLLSTFRMHLDHEPIAPTASWSAATCRRFPRRDVSRRNKARTCPRTPKNLRLAIRFMESLLSIFRMHWSHEPGRRNGARLCEPQHVALQTKLLRVTDPRSEIRFMERAGVWADFAKA